MPAKTKKQVRKSTARSVMGKLLPPVDVTSMSQLNDLEKRIKTGPLTLVLVYADWCGHCQRFKPMMNELETCPGRSVQVARIRDDMYPKSSLSSIPTEGYPSLLLIQQDGTPVNFQDTNGTSTTVIPDHTNELKMKTLIRNAGTPTGIELIQSAPNANAIQTMSAPSVSNLSYPSQAPVSETLPGTAPAPSGIIADRLSPANVARLNESLINTQDALLKEATKPIGSQQGGRRGGLFDTLMIASQRLAPAAALLLASSAVSTRSRKRTRRTTRRRALKRKN